MWAKSFFFKKRPKKHAAIDEDIAEITKVIKTYTNQSRIRLEHINPCMSPELAELNMKEVKIINSGIEAHQKRLSTLGKMKHKQMISQDELDLLTMMPVFQKYENYPNVDSVVASPW